jgi:hypothetical protein
LLWYCRSEPIVLTAIIPNGGSTESETFRPAEEQERLRDWIDARQGSRNLYFTVNPTTKVFSGKVRPKKEDMKGMTTLHVDIDPRAGEDLERERERAFRVLKQFSPPPSAIIDSGGGFQGFWILDRLYETNGSEDAAADLERYNQKIVIELQADACHNIDRIMRLPGTINVPDQKKIKKGRVARTARLVEYNDNVYPLTAFTPAPKVQSIKKCAGGEVKISGNLPRVDLDTLSGKAPNKLKTIIVQGDDPEDLDRFGGDRSKVVWFVCCELIRSGRR